MDRFKDCGLIRSVHLPESLFALLRSDLFLVFLKLAGAVASRVLTSIYFWNKSASEDWRCRLGNGGSTDDATDDPSLSA